MLLLLLLRRFSRVWLRDPIDSSPPGSPVPGILQARTLEWVAISFSNAWKWKVKVKMLSCVQLLATPWAAAYQAPLSVECSRQEYWSGVPSPSPQNDESHWRPSTSVKRHLLQVAGLGKPEGMMPQINDPQSMILQMGGSSITWETC